VAIRADGAVLLETRPEKGLLGGMLGWPTTEWSTDPATPSPPLAADWEELSAQARHTFTHFHLILTIQVARLPADARPNPEMTRGEFRERAAFRPSDLPTVMRKVYDLAKDREVSGKS